jgi:hypothetical protein
MIELRETEIDALIRRGLLSSETRNDPGAVVEALYAFLDSTLDETPLPSSTPSCQSPPLR